MKFSDVEASAWDGSQPEVYNVYWTRTIIRIDGKDYDISHVTRETGDGPKCEGDLIVLHAAPLGI